MKEMMKTIGAWLAKNAAARKTRHAAQRERMLEEDAKRRIQVREYEGELFVCFDDQPLMWESDLRMDMAETLKHAREIYVCYHTSKDEHYGTRSK